MKVVFIEQEKQSRKAAKRCVVEISDKATTKITKKQQQQEPQRRWKQLFYF